MPIKVVCPNGHTLQVKDEHAGKSGLCPLCQARIQVPKPEMTLEDEVLSLLGKAVPRPPKPAEAPTRPARPAAEAAPPARRPVADEPAVRKEKVPAGGSQPESALLKRKRVCPKCCEIVSLTFAECPYCRTSLADWTFPLPDEKRPEQSGKTSCHFLGVRKQDRVVIVRFGEHRILDEAAVHKIGSELCSVADRPDCHHLLLNFSGVEGLSSLMLGTLLMLRTKMAAKKGQIKLCQVGLEIHEVFTATKLGQLFEILDNEQKALKAFG